jgi:hypothetical protein
VSELVVCIPGPWVDRASFLESIILLEPAGRYLAAGGVLADVAEQDLVELDLAPADPDMLKAFTMAAQGRIPQETLDAVAAHASVAYLQFPADLPAQNERIAKFTDLMRQAGGIAVKVESSGTAHAWDAWQAMLGGNEFDLYCAMVLLVADDRSFYSCGMHLFGLPDCSVPDSIDAEDAAELMNQFNFWRIQEQPLLQTGHTFSMSADAPLYRLTLGPDPRHADGDTFHNSWGVWSIDPD